MTFHSKDCCGRTKSSIGFNNTSITDIGKISKDCCGRTKSSIGFNNTSITDIGKISKQVQGRKITNMFEDNDINQTI
jgi:hypothetical protein